MYKVLIVDDEPTIVEGIRKLIPWERYDCKVVATADNGAAGAKAIRDFAVNIVFTDICMPLEDGLTMIAGVKSEFPELQITILTGYRDFNYIQTALNLGVSKFLLKPSKMSEIEEAIETMTANLKKLGVQSEELSEDSLQAKDNSASFIIRLATSYIEEHCHEKFTLSDVAEVCFVSQWHLSKLLKKFTGQSFYDLLNKARIEKAKKLLADPSLRISEISDMLGYTDAAHFSRVFKKSEGMGANNYRNTKINFISPDLQK